MRNKLPFFLTLVLSVIAVFVFNSESNAQSQRVERRNDKQYKQIRPVGRQGQVVVTSSSSRAHKTNTYTINDDFYKNNRYYESNSYGNISQIARLNGYEDGLHEGAKDARDGDRFDPFGEDDYEDGDGGYKSRYGNKAEYKQIYRQSFLRGYREAFNRYLGSNANFNW